MQYFLDFKVADYDLGLLKLLNLAFNLGNMAAACEFGYNHDNGFESSGPA